MQMHILSEIINAPKSDQKLWRIVSTIKLPFGPEYLQYKYGWHPDFAAGAIEEYRRFALLALTSANMITPSEIVDEVWHCHILHTLAYEKFAQVCGKKLQHVPGMPNEKASFAGSYERTLQLYQSVFSEDAPRTYWPRNDGPKILQQETSVAIADALEIYLQAHMPNQSASVNAS